MLVAISVIVSFILLVCLINTAIILLLGSAVVQLIEKLKASQGDKSLSEPEKAWYSDV